MIARILLAFGLTTSALWAQPPSVRTLATELPEIPSGVAPATYPLPRTEWVVNVSNVIAEGQKVASTTRVVVDGDSIPAGWRRFWGKHFPDISAYNFSMAGDRTQNLLWRVDQGQLDNFHPAAVLLMIGTNNIGNMESIEETVAGVKAVVTAYQKRCPDAVIYLHALLPRGETEIWREKVKAVNAGIVALADQKRVFFLDVSSSFLKPDGSIDKSLMPDLLHPNEAGYAAWAKQLLPILSKHDR